MISFIKFVVNILFVIFFLKKKKINRPYFVLDIRNLYILCLLLIKHETSMKAFGTFKLNTNDIFTFLS
jgi:hypothetical protein